MPNHTPLSAFPLISRTELSFLQGIIPNSAYEIVYDNVEYFTIVVIYPNRKRIMQFNQMYARMEKKFGVNLIPACSLVSKGVYGSYFVVYMRKEVLAA